MQAQTVRRVVIGSIGGVALMISIATHGLGPGPVQGTIGGGLDIQSCTSPRLVAAIAALNYLLLPEVGASADQIELAKAHVDYLLLDEVIAGRDGAVGDDLDWSNCRADRGVGVAG
jgi:hypothetical protein